MTSLALLGRFEHLEAIDRAIEKVEAGEIVVLSLLGSLGSGRGPLLDECENRVRRAGIEVRRTEAYPAIEVQPGGLADTVNLSIEDVPSAPTAVLIAEAQWADGTSLATVQGVMARATSGLLIVGSHTEITGYRRLAFQQLAGAAARLGSFEELTLDPLTIDDIRPIAGGDDPEGLAQLFVERSAGNSHDFTTLVAQWLEAGTLEWRDDKLVPIGPPPQPSGVFDRVATLDRPARKLVEAASVASKPLSVDVAASLLDMPSDDVLELGESLAADGYLRQTAAGFAPINAATCQRVVERLGEVRRARLFGDLAGAHQRLGLDERDPSVVGGYYLEAAEWDEALSLLARAGLAAADRQALGEALPLVEGALRAYEESGADDGELEGRLRLARAQCYRLAAWSDLAAADADVAASRLTGSRKVDALGYATSVADDLQHDQDAERYVMAGLYEAVRAAEHAKHGSLLTLHARVLSRLGFAAEADAEFEKGKEILLRHGNEVQQHWGRYNGAWVAFDRGQARQADVAFEELVGEADDIGGSALRSDREAWWSRALFLRGRIAQALATRRSAVEHADLSGTTGPVFLSHMSLSEGALLVGRYGEALDSADDMLAVVVQQGMAWENAARYLRAKAMFGMGRLAEAAEEVQLAQDASPGGIDGWRWRLKIRVLQMAIDGARGVEWPEDEALTLTDELLHGNWYLPAVELLTARAIHEKDPRLAEEAAALAMQLGVPMAAADAIQAGDLWKKPISAAVVVAVKEMAEHLPDDWLDDWSGLPAVAPALAAPDVADEAYEAAVAELEGELEESLAAAGFGSVDTLLSPAQRRAGGLRRRPRRRPLWQLLAAGLGGAGILAAGVALAFIFLGDQGTTDTTTTATTATTAPVTATTAPLEAWEFDLQPPTHGSVVGQWSFRADIGSDNQAGLPGVSSTPGVRSIDGFYWKSTLTANPIRSSPAIRGGTIIFASDQNLYGMVVSSGPDWLWRAPTGGEVTGAPILAEVTGQGASPDSADTETRVFFGSSDGRLRSREALQAGSQVFEYPPIDEPRLGAIVAAPLVMNDVVFFGTDDGQVWALDAVTLEPVWDRDFFDTVSAVTVAPVGSDGALFVGTEAGQVWKIDAATGLNALGEGEVCYDTRGTIRSDMLIVDGVLYIPAEDARSINAVRAGSCALSPKLIQLNDPALSPPAIEGDLAYVGNGGFLEARDLTAATVEETTKWRFPDSSDVGALDSPVVWPVAAQDVIYFTSGVWLYAVDKETGAELWKYSMGATSTTSPAPAKGAVFVADTSGTLHAIGCQNPPDCEPSG